jgi:hypothetical protein
MRYGCWSLGGGGQTVWQILNHSVIIFLDRMRSDYLGTFLIDTSSSPYEKNPLRRRLDNFDLRISRGRSKR